jgi:hypothetical protein
MGKSQSETRPGAGGQLLDPRGRVEVEEKGLAPRLESLEGTTVGLLDNAKPNADRFLDAVGEMLVDEYGVEAVERASKHAAAVSGGSLLPELRAECDAVVNAYGDCGSCTSWCVHDSATLELQGVPTATINSDEFVRLGQSDARALGLPGLPLVTVPHPMGDVSPDVVRGRARDTIAEIAAVLTTSRTELDDEYRGKFLGENEELTDEDLYCPL